MNRRLLAISWDMPPLSGPRAVQVSRTLKHLVPIGWESSVVCFGPRSGRYNQDRELASRLQAPDGVTLVPVPSLEDPERSLVAECLRPLELEATHHLLEVDPAPAFEQAGVALDGAPLDALAAAAAGVLAGRLAANNRRWRAQFET